MTCCDTQDYNCPPGCTVASCPGQCTAFCSNERTVSCVTNGTSCVPGIEMNQCLSGFPVSGSCYTTETCPDPANQAFCGGCIADCRPRTQTCAQWITAECEGDTGDGNPPTAPPGCSASCSAPFCGQPNGCGGFCSTSDGQRFLTTPMIVSPSDGSNHTGTTVAVNWPSIANRDDYRVQVEEVVAGTNPRIVDINTTSSSYTFNPGTLPGYGSGGYIGKTFRVRVKARQDLCPNSEWSPWVRFSMNPLAPSCSISVSPSAPSVTAGGTTTVTGTVTFSGGTVSQVAFASGNTNVATLNKTTDTTVPYNAVLTGVSGGTANITLTATVSNGVTSTTCASTVTATVGQIAGQLCEDDRIAYGNTGSACFTLPNGCTPYSPDSNELVSVSRGGFNYAPVAVQSDGTFRVNVPPNSGYTVDLSSDDFLNTCVCPGGCSFTNVSAPNTTVRYYYRPAAIRDAWWQTINGFVYAGNTTGASVYSQIPEDTCITVPEYTCKPYASLRNTQGGANSSGGIITGGGTIDLSNESGLQTDTVDEDGRNYRVTGTSVSRLIENWDYFYRLYGFNNPNNDINNPSSKPTNPPSNGAAYYRNGNLSINSAWSVNANESIVVFVNGNLTINNTITVANGGFLAFIVNGNISIGTTVCQSNFLSNTAVVQGVFIADGSFSVASQGSGDCKFVGEGIFAGLGGVGLNRDFQDNAAQEGYNAVAPVEVFRYRPDFVINTPDEMKRALYQWQEVAP